MRHYKKGRKLGTDTSHTKAMKKSLVCALLANDRIKTIDSRAKEIRPDVDKIITWAKRGDLHSKRQVFSFITKETVAKKVIDELGPKYKDQNGGYCRIIRTGPRRGDAAEMAIIELV